MVFWVARPKHSRLLAIWNPYRKSDLEDTYPQKRRKTSGTRMFVSDRVIVRYSGRVNWCLGSFNTTTFQFRGKKRVSLKWRPRINTRWMVKRGHAPEFLGQTRVLTKDARGRCFHVPQPASNSILTRWQHAPSPCRARALFVFGHVVGANGTAAHEGSKWSPLLITCWGNMPPQLY